jgi:tRNA pseudouridine38-40 synthase
MRIKLTIAYDGTRFCGWQVQPNGLSIQTLVQKAIETVLRHPIGLTGSGRTDAGVHARGQTAHFDTGIAISFEKLRYSANALLPPDIRILKAEEVPADWHARYDACGKIYHYHLQIGSICDPMNRLYCTPVYGKFNLDALRQAAHYLIGTHDFVSFANVWEGGTAAHDSIRTLKRLDIVEANGGIRLEFEGDGFLYKMVRNIVGTLLEAAAGSRPSSDIELIFQKKDRRLAGFTAAPQGLFLMKVLYKRVSTK